MNGTDADRLREIERLSQLAQWYRGWAEVAGNDHERERRRAWAAHIDARVAVLKDGHHDGKAAGRPNAQ
jgi:hypothetical protein